MAVSAKPVPIEPNGRQHAAVTNTQNLSLHPVMDGIETRESTPQGVYLLRFATLLFKWRWAILAVVVLALIGGVTVTLLTTPLYQATAMLRIDREAPKVLNMATGEAVADSRGQEFYQTEYGVLRSRSTAERAVDALNLADDPQFFRGQTREKGSSRLICKYAGGA